MEGAERERERVAESPPARPDTSSSPASPHVVVDVVEEDEPVPTPAAHSSAPRLPPLPPTPTRTRTLEDSPPPPPPPRTATANPDGKASPPTPPPPPLRTPTAKPDGKPSSPPPPPPLTPTMNGNIGDKVSTAPPPSPPPPPPTQTGYTTPPMTSTGLNTSSRSLLPASEMCSSSAANPIPHTSSTSSELFKDEDTRFRLRDIELTNREQALEEETKLAKKLRNDNEIKRRNNEITLRQWGEQMDSREDEIATKEQELRAAELSDRERRLKYREDALNNPLLEQDDQNKQNKQDDDVWDKRQNLMAITLACGLSALISMQPLLPPDYIPCIVGMFAIMWVLATIAFPVGLFGASRIEKDFSRHISRLTFLSFALFGLYILSQPPAPSSLRLASSPVPLQPPQEYTLEGRTVFYIALGLVIVCGHVASWVLGCRTGSDRDL